MKTSDEMVLPTCVIAGGVLPEKCVAALPESSVPAALFAKGWGRAWQMPLALVMVRVGAIQTKALREIVPT